MMIQTQKFSLAWAVTVTAILILLSGNSVAQTDSDHPSHIDQLDTSTLGYTRIDLQTANIDKTIDLLLQVTGDSRSSQQIEAIRKPAKALFEAVRSVGGKQVYLHLSASDIASGGPFGWITVEEDADIEGARKTLEQMLAAFGMQAKAAKNGILIGFPQTLQRLENNPLPGRRDAQEYLGISSEHPVAVVFAPSADQLRVLREMVGPFPAPLNRINGAQLADGASQIVMAMEPNQNDQAIHLKVTGSDSTANKFIKLELEDLADSLSRTPSLLDQKMPDALRLLLKGVFESLQVADRSFSERSFKYSFSSKTGSLLKLSESLSLTFKIAESAARDTDLINRLRQVVLAGHNFHDAYKTLPPSSFNDAQGNPLLSWRVAILPFIEEGELYKKFKLDEPWNSEHNIQLVKEIPRCFQSDADLTSQGKTTCMMVFGNGGIGRSTEPLALQQIKDGTSRTIHFVRSTKQIAVEWTKPQDWEFDPANPKKNLIDEGATKFAAAFADGSVMYIDAGINPKDLTALFTANGKELVRRPSSAQRSNGSTATIAPIDKD